MSPHQVPSPSTLAGSLKGLRVLDVSRVLAGPFCTQILADLGAEVIKVEQPMSGDETRGWGPPFVGPLSAYFLAANRGKKSVTLNLKSVQARQILGALAQKSDIVVENFVGATRASLGLSPQDLHALNPRLVILSISGFGANSVFAGRPGYDFAIQAMSGLMEITGPVEGPPTKVGVAITDIVTGLYGAIGILAGIHARQGSGHGYHIDLALLDCAFAAQANVAQVFLSTGKMPPRIGNAHLQIVPYELFATADGWLVLAVGNDEQWRRFCAVAGEASLGDDPSYRTNELRVRGRSTLIPKLKVLLSQRSTAEWGRLLASVEIPHGPVWTYADLMASVSSSRPLSMVARTPTGETVELVRSPLLDPAAAVPQCPPILGGDTAEVLGNLLRLSESELDHLRADGVL